MIAVSRAQEGTGICRQMYLTADAWDLLYGAIAPSEGKRSFLERSTGDVWNREENKNGYIFIMD